MKNLLLLITVVFVLPLCSFAQTKDTTGCSDLFISELVFGDSIIGSNYAVEIFNPTQDSISLINYSLILTNNLGILTTINPNGKIAPGKVFVVCNSNADANLLQLADNMQSNLDFKNNVILELKNNTITIDRIGETGTPTLNTFDVNRIKTDAVDYLATIHIDLNDYKNMNLRRGMFVKNGEPNFSTSNIIGKWAYYSNTDLSHIGQHKCSCNRSPLDLPFFGFTWDEGYLEESHQGSFSDPLWLTSVPSYIESGVFVQMKIEETSSANCGLLVNDDYQIMNSSNNVSCSGAQQKIYGTGGSMMLLVTNEHYFAGFKDVNITLESPNNDFYVDGASSTYHVNIFGGYYVGEEEILNNKDVKIFPNVTSNFINVYSKYNLQYSIFNVDGICIKKGDIKDQKNQIDVFAFSKGCFFIQFTDNKSFFKTEKIIKY